MPGLTAYGAYLPRHRLQRAELAAALGAPAGRGARVVASYDEDATTLAVEAARRALTGTQPPPEAVYFATTAPPYLDKTNASALHAALDLGQEGLAIDVAGSARGAVGALLAALRSGGLAAMGDVRTGRPGSADERDGADGGAAFLAGGSEPAIAELVAHASLTAEFLDRWRAPGAAASQTWEERFGLEEYMPLIERVYARALADGGIERADRVVVSSPHQRAAATARRRLGASVSCQPPLVGYAGAADLGLGLADALDRAAPGESILLISAADGADALLLRTTPELERARAADPVAAQFGSGRDVSYASFLTWRGMLEREPPRRPEPERPAAPPSARAQAWKYALVGSRCLACGRVHAPPARVCSGCHAVDRMAREPLAGRRGTVATYTVDRLAFSPSPPMIDAVVDFDGGGRYSFELTDATPDEVQIGTRVEMTFRRLYTSGGVHNYFWKARPIDG
jgi:hydroxymethylglutaryl-CoA synthase